MGDFVGSRVAGRYELIREIGRGAMGRVFEAVDTETGQHVAAKLLLAGSEIDLQALLRFQREGTLLASLEHPNIVRVYGTYLEEDSSAIIMELLEGQTLGDLMQSEALSFGRTQQIMLHVASALAYAHSRAIIHRDIKPGNIMVMGEDEVKVTDFGIARVVQDNVPFGTLTGTGVTLGTPWYMSPEQIEGGRVDGRSDIYSFGAVLYQMVTGKPPFVGKDPVTIAFQHVHKAAQPPGSLNPDVPPDWEDLILTCLAKNPNDRYQTATALQETLATLGGSSRSVPRPIETDVHEAEARALADQAREKELAGDISGAWREYRAALTIAPPGSLREELLAAVDRTAPGAAGSATDAAPLLPAPAGPESPDASTQVVGRAPTATPVWRRLARSRLALLLGSAGVLVIAGIAALILLRSSTSTAAPAIKLNMSGVHHGALYRSGQTMRLSWSQPPGASAYRLQVVTSATDPSDATLFKHPSLSRLVSGNSYGLRVVGRQYYFWRVQADVRGIWGRYTHSTHFLVAGPAIAAPFPLTPPNSSSLTVNQAHLCWSRVRGAADYILNVVGAEAANPQRSTCAWISVRPGNYRWRVAARVKGVRLYAGPYSSPAYFTILAPPTASPQPLPTPAAQPTVPPATQPAAVPTRVPSKPAVKRPGTRPSATPHPTASPTPAPIHKKLSFIFNGLAITTASGQASSNFAVKQDFVVAATFTIHNLAAGHTVQVQVQRVRKRVLANGQLRVILRSTVTLAGHNGRNVYRYTTNAINRGTYRIVLSVTIKGHTKTHGERITVS